VTTDGLEASTGGEETLAAVAAPLVVEIADGVAEITLTRPELLNRFDLTLHNALPDVFDELDANTAVRAIVLASTGRVFSAGGDTDLMLRSHNDLLARMETHERGKRLVRSVLNVHAPVVVALHADVYGVGATVVLNSDAVVSTPGVKIADPHVNIGLVAGDGGCVAWPSAAGILRARRHLLTGDPVLSQDAYQFGMISDLVPSREEVLPAARVIARKIASLPPLAVQGTKRSLARLSMARVYEVLDYSFAQQAITSASEDLVEAITAFKERRAGVYEGR
jgi:enoyl-CoA hydratase/carnithine racemase